MDAVKYLKEAERMCDTIGMCECCPFGSSKAAFPCGSSLSSLDTEYPEKAVEIVEKWANEHPAKTRQSEFLKMHPNVQQDAHGIIAILPCKLNIRYKPDCTNDSYCDKCRKEYWLEEVE